MKIWFKLMAAAAVLLGSTAQADPQRIDVWHSLKPAHREVFQSMVSRFNREQNEVEVHVQHAPSSADLQSGLAEALKAGNPPHFVELADNHAPETVAKQNRILPLHQLLAKYPLADAQWFLPQTTSFVRDSRSRLLALPLMAEIPVLFYNRDLFTQVGLNPDKPPRTWRELQDQLLALRAAGAKCPYATSHMAWVHQENLSMLNNKPFASRNNGLDGGKVQLLVGDSLHVRHMALMSSWARSKLLVVATVDGAADELFATGQCAVLSSGTGAWATLVDAPFSTGVAMLPIYSEATKQPGIPLVGGSSLWATSGHSAAEEKAMAAFVAWLAKPTVAAEWHQRTGFLPLTDAAFRAADISFYERIPGARTVVLDMEQASDKDSRGARLNQYSEVLNILNEETWAALTGAKPALQAQNDAARRATVAMNGG